MIKQNDEVRTRNDELKTRCLYSSFRVPNSSFLLCGGHARTLCATIRAQQKRELKSNFERNTMAENENALAAPDATPAEGQTGGSDATTTTETPAEAAPASTEEITYHAVEKDGQVTALWEMQGRKHLRTIDPRSRQGQEILRLYTAEHHDEQ
jgi:hypothetical protein